MITQLEKIGDELARARMRLAQQEKRVKDLEERYRQVEKTTVNEIVQAANVTPAQLAEILEAAKKGILGLVPGVGDGGGSNEGGPPGEGRMESVMNEDITTGNGSDSSHSESEDLADEDSPEDVLPDIGENTFLYPDDNGYSLFGKEDE